MLAKNITELEEMMKDLLSKCRKAGLSINTKNTKILGNGEKRNINWAGGIIEGVDEIDYLGQTNCFKNKWEKEIKKKNKEKLGEFWGTEVNI